MASSPGATCAICSTCSPTGPNPASSNSPPRISSKPSSKKKLSGDSTKIPSVALSWPSLADPHISQALYVAPPFRVRTRLSGRILSISAPPPPADPAKHGLALKQSLLSIESEAKRRRADAGLVVLGAEPGVYVEFDSQPGFGLKLESLDASGSGIELVSVIETDTIERATVFVPDGKVGHFIKRFEQYAAEFTKNGSRKHKGLVEGIAELRLATLRALWTDVA